MKNKINMKEGDIVRHISTGRLHKIINVWQIGTVNFISNNNKEDNKVRYHNELELWDGKIKTHQDAWDLLSLGCRLKNITWNGECYIELKNGNIMDEIGCINRLDSDPCSYIFYGQKPEIKLTINGKEIKLGEQDELDIINKVKG